MPFKSKYILKNKGIFVSLTTILSACFKRNNGLHLCAAKILNSSLTGLEKSIREYWFLARKLHKKYDPCQDHIEEEYSRMEH